MEWSEVLEIVKMGLGHASMGFLMGFCSSFVITAPDQLQMATLGAAAFGVQGALKQLLTYLESINVRKTTGARYGNVQPSRKTFGKYFA